MSKEKTCGTCAHRDQGPNLGEGLCVRCPPTVLAIVVPTSSLGQLGVQILSQFPTVKNEARCSEWKGKGLALATNTVD